MAATPEAPERSETTASPLDRHASPVSDHATPQGRHDGRATAALIVSIVAIPLALLAPILGLVPGLVGMILGIVAKKDIQRTGNRGYSHAKWGMILGIVALVICVLNAIAGAIILAS